MQIKVSEVLKLLDRGLNRDEIASHYNITKKEVGILFKHPLLKGKRTKLANKVSFIVVDDISMTEDSSPQFINRDLEISNEEGRIEADLPSLEGYLEFEEEVEEVEEDLEEDIKVFSIEDYVESQSEQKKAEKEEVSLPWK
jgi:transcriptional regulator